MRPINITISAFGPFAELTEIPLNKLGEDGLYLITGDTGAGKTTVFDAICFALYGEASGIFRSKASDYRCTYAEPSTPTFVKYEFEYNSKRYLITRNPEYEKPKLKKEGTTKEIAKAELVLPSGEVISRVGDVNRAVEELIGLTYNQFTQISMLAQGEFQKLLNADTKERIEIFRRIFNTQLYQTFGLRLKDRFFALEKDYNEQKRAINQYIESISYSDDDGINLRIDELKVSGVFSTDEICSILEHICASDTLLQKKLLNDISSLDKQIEGLTSSITVAKGIEAAANELNLRTEQLIKLNEKAAALNIALSNAQGKQPLREQILSKIGIINNEMPEYERLTDLLNEGKLVSERLKLSSKRLTALQMQIDSYDRELSKQKSEMSELEGSDVLLMEARHNYELQINRYELLKELDDSVKKLKIAESELQSSRESYMSARSTFADATAKHNRLEQLFFDAQAGILALRLADGVPCPVCGSVEHTCRATLPEGAPNEDCLKASKSELDSLQAKTQQSAIFAEKCSVAYKALKNEIDANAKKLLEGNSFEAVNAELSVCISRKSELMATIAALDLRVKRKEKLSKSIPLLEQQLDNANTEAVQLSSSVSALNEKRSQLLSQYNDTISRLQFKSFNEAQDALNELQSRAEQIKKEIELAEYDFNECKEKLHRTQERVSALNDTVKTAQKYNLDELNDSMLKADALRKSTRLEHQRISIRLATNSDILNAIRKVSEHLNKLAEQIKNIAALSNTANGALSKKDKLLFETYIQMTWFDRVIIMANLRFAQMTGGQYRLIRRTCAENKISQSGLDLNIIDYKNGTTRSVKTLSGGESFKASLSLALGLSDVVQSISGGVHLDAMFIDEGFGSLDGESLSQAMSVLRQLSDSNRSVAIISHVNELKSCIDRQLIISKDSNGISRIKIEA